MTTTQTKNSALTCHDGGVRFGAYNGRVTTTPVLDSTTIALPTTAAVVVTR
ncbi:hypothetical protein [Streptomyces sp. NPDC052496]|uniref:hypothetical protein n=1 Tax=Streptomyces sp. NPDC052496 TaxID=3154951 RepID=UPI003414F706